MLFWVGWEVEATVWNKEEIPGIYTEAAKSTLVLCEGRCVDIATDHHSGQAFDRNGRLHVYGFCC